MSRNKRNKHCQRQISARADQTLLLVIPLPDATRGCYICQEKCVSGLLCLAIPGLGMVTICQSCDRRIDQERNDTTTGNSFDLLGFVRTLRNMYRYPDQPT